MRRRAGPLETVWVVVGEGALDAYEAALSSVCETVGFFWMTRMRGPGASRVCGMWGRTRRSSALR